MSIEDIKNNADNLSELDKNTLVDYVEELLVLNKKKDSKIMSLRNDIRFNKRQMTKVKNMIDKSLNSENYKKDKVWKSR